MAMTGEGEDVCLTLRFDDDHDILVVPRQPDCKAHRGSADSRHTEDQRITGLRSLNPRVIVHSR